MLKAANILIGFSIGVILLFFCSFSYGLGKDTGISIGTAKAIEVISQESGIPIDNVRQSYSIGIYKEFQDMGERDSKVCKMVKKLKLPIIQC